MIHPDTELKLVSEDIGLGVFAKKPIPKGTIVYVKDPLEISISSEAFESLPDIVKEKADRYSYIEPSGSRILSWDNAKFVNHCCDANTISTGYGFEIAIRDIAAGEEITDDYGMFNIPHEMKLYCDCKNCRKVLRASDFEGFVPKWDKAIKSAMKNLRKVDQPLLPLVAHTARNELFYYLDTGKGYVSVKELQLYEQREEAVAPLVTNGNLKHPVFAGGR